MAAIDVESNATWRASARTLGSRRLTSVHRLGVDRFGQLDVDPCLVDAVAERRIGRRLDRQQFAAGPPPRPEHRIHDGRVGHPEPVQQHGDGVHQHRRVVGDDLQRGAESGRVVVGVDRNPGVAEGPVPAQSVVGVDQGRRHQRARDVRSTGPVTAESAPGASPWGPR